MNTVIDRNSVQYYYRYHTLWLTAEQTLELEIWFGMVRAITNHLLSLTQHLSKTDAQAVRWTMEDATIETLKMMNLHEGTMFERCSPVILRSILAAWVSEWEDFRNNRIKRPEFKQSRDEQSLWLLEQDAMADYQTDQFKLHGPSTVIFGITPPRIELPRKSTAYLITRDKEGTYSFAALHERNTGEVHPNQDPEVTKWGQRVISIEREARELRRRYGPSHQNIKNAECRVLALRKIILHRILRQRDAKVQSNVVPFNLKVA